MNASAGEAIEFVSTAFKDTRGPALFRFPESGQWYDWEGKRLAKALLDLDPRFLVYEDIVGPGNCDFLPSWANSESLLWLVPGIIRVSFEVRPESGDNLLRNLFADLLGRIEKGDLTLTQAQQQALLATHEIFYCSEDFEWNSEIHTHPLCVVLNQCRNDDAHA